MKKFFTSKNFKRAVNVAGLLLTAYFIISGHVETGVVFAITFGSTSAPSNYTEYLDSLFTQSIVVSRKVITDNIAATNAFLNKLKASDFYESCDGGEYIKEPLMYALAPMDSYDGYDELSTLTTDGVTAALYEWRQLASPISYSMKEVIQNRNGMTNLVTTRINQSMLGMEEGWSNMFFQGSGAGALATAKVSSLNGSSGISPIGNLVHYTPSASVVVGNINQSTSSWWRNKTGDSAATTYEGFLQEVDHAYNSAALGSGGPPDLMITDQITYELIVHAYFAKYRVGLSDGPPDFPFECKKFKKAILVMEDKVPDAYNGAVTAATNGTIYFLNTKFFRVRYDPERDWSMLKDENGKSFAKPITGDSRLGHMAWMGNVTCNNRRKQSVLGKIARTLIAP